METGIEAKTETLLDYVMPYLLTLCIHSFIHPFIWHVLNTYYRPCIAQDPGDTKINKIQSSEKKRESYMLLSTLMSQILVEE